MGIYDREYYRDEPRRPGVGDWSAVTTLIVLNVAVFIADMFSPDHWIVNHLLLPPDIFSHPWHFWQLLTYGFLHDPRSIMHILFNMYALWLFGPDVEAIYGKAEFYRLYISLVILSGLGWAVLANVLHEQTPGVIGASGAIMGIIIIYILHFPHRIFLLFFAIPMPAWVLGIVFVVLDLSGAAGGPKLTQENVANTAHLAGVVFGIIYYQTHLTLFSFWPKSWKLSSLRRPKYRVHRGAPDDASRDPAPAPATGR